MIEGISSVYTLYIINKYVPMSKVLNKGGDLTVLNQLLLRMYKKLINAECVIAQPVDSPQPITGQRTLKSAWFFFKKKRLRYRDSDLSVPKWYSSILNLLFGKYTKVSE